ncbi:molybdenum cofactor cytidylyltransferase [Halogranum amylolyticum]|uniref:Molybdenum cofactor cytidylyltransferase n=1 Tax=Halogranum amylolyticum TaxID=660520 RepID=A0A1H8WE72_9EURY|nr:nucleotidyltransferase family protein [Halogranum amylolyticum]SEP25960.1 molybdenum cofactor cytidylyltransferase [Halogranum amylolyticum]
MVDADDTNEANANGRQGRVAAVVLAAGVGSRFDGGNKLLVGVDDDPLVRRATETVCAAAVDPVVVVLGHDAERVREALTGLPVETVTNPRYDAGQSTSVAVGVDALPVDVEYAVFALGDMPDVTVETVDRLVAAARETDADAVVPTYEEQRGNPVVFHRRRFDALAAVDGDRGGRALFDDSTVTRLAVDDSGVHRDVDTRDDLDDRDRP